MSHSLAGTHGCAGTLANGMPQPNKKAPVPPHRPSWPRTHRMGFQLLELLAVGSFEVSDASSRVSRQQTGAHVGEVTITKGTRGRRAGAWSEGVEC